MIKIGQARIIEHTSELPDVRPRVLYADVETTGTNGMALHPYRGDRICGWAVTFDDCPHAYYIPIRHRAPGSNNLDPVVVSAWIQRLLESAEDWVNHNLKFDAHFALQDGIEVPDHVRWVDTVLPAKMIDSDRYNHKLKPLCRDVCGLPMEEEEEIERYLDAIKSKDYGRVPIDILGRYACMDVLGNRALWKWQQRHREPEQKDLWAREFKLTPVLFDMERAGLTVDRERTLKTKRETLIRMLTLCDEVHTDVGVELIDSNACCTEILLDRLGLPTVKNNYAKDDPDRITGPSFDKEAMKLYAGHPDVVTDSRKRRIVAAIREFRTLTRLLGLFVNPFLEKVDEFGLLHSNYNQIIRTGRMSCSDPNAQQFNPAAGELIVPDSDAYTFVCYDASQVEFRLNVHYCQIKSAIEAYRSNPKTDFHQHVADFCEVQRSPGKTINFSVSYGAGRKNVTGQLVNNEDVMREVFAEGMTPDEYRHACAVKSDAIWMRYHSEFPEVSTTAQRARAMCAQRGWIRNAYGRRRHLPAEFSHRAFNSLIQGCAMDLIKERMIAVAPRYRPDLRELDITMKANKHDELLFQMPHEAVDEMKPKLRAELENVQQDFRVPFLWDAHTGSNWKEAKP